MHVAKIGGSLLELTDLPKRFHNWRIERDEVPCLLVVGGGKEVDALRTANAKGTLGDEQAHWQAIERMDENTRNLAGQMESVSVLCVSSFLRHIEPFMPGVKLPVGWNVTSDSIAARVAIATQADELHLFKSRLPTESEAKSLETLVEADYIDPFMLELAGEIPRTTAWDLRAESDESMVLAEEKSVG